MVSVKAVKDAFDGNVFNVTNISEDGSMATVGGERITLEQAEKVAKMTGWEKHYINAFECLRKSKSYMKALSEVEDSRFWTNAKIEFSNTQSSTYGKTFDRVRIQCLDKLDITVIVGMPTSKHNIEIFDPKTSVMKKSLPRIAKLSEYIDAEMEKN